jgi:hypothetical protein
VLGAPSTRASKSEVDYNNSRWYRNIVFDEGALNKGAEFFPERQIKTDDATKLIQELGVRTPDRKTKVESERAEDS